MTSRSSAGRGALTAAAPYSSMDTSQCPWPDFARTLRGRSAQQLAVRIALARVNASDAEAESDGNFATLAPSFPCPPSVLPFGDVDRFQ